VIAAGLKARGPTDSNHSDSDNRQFLISVIGSGQSGVQELQASGSAATS
jgi:hypothetical protein